MAFLAQNQPVPQAEIVALALHVDYWNRLGWKDEFSSPLFSQRQEVYGQRFKLASVYTPQMIVDGNWEFTGGNTGKAAETIAEAASAPKAKTELAAENGQLKIKIVDLPAHGRATVFLAVAEDNLTSQVGAGENRGKKLEHMAVVRELKAVGLIEPAARDFAADLAVPANPVWKKENVRLVVFVQDNASRRILAVGKLDFRF